MAVLSDNIYISLTRSGSSVLCETISCGDEDAATACVLDDGGEVTAIGCEEHSSGTYLRAFINQMQSRVSYTLENGGNNGEYVGVPIGFAEF